MTRQHPHGTLCLRIDDIDVIAAIPNSVPEHTQYRLVGRDSVDNFRNKTLTSLSNNISANNVTSGGTVYPISGTPSVGDTLKLTAPGVLSWGPGGGSAPLPTQVVYVRVGGNDGTGNGTLDAPFLTISHAMSTITDATYDKRYIIDVGPGEHSDSFAIRAWVFLIGAGVLAARLNGNITINDASWAIGGVHSDVRAGIKNCSLRGTVAINFGLGATSPYGKFYFWGCWVNNLVTFTGVSNINQVIIEEGLWFQGIDIVSTVVSTNGWLNQGGIVTLRSGSNPGVIACQGGSNLGALTLLNTGGAAPTSTLLSCPTVGVITADSGTTLAATVDSLPQHSAMAVSGTLTLLSDAYGLAYNPTAPSKWATLPISAQVAIDRLAAAIYLINGSIPI